MPLFLLLFISFVVAILWDKKIAWVLFFLNIFVFVFLFNLTKTFDSDFRVYASQFVGFMNVSLNEFLKIGGWSVRRTEPGFYFLMDIVSKLSHGNLFYLVLLINTMIYGIYIASLLSFKNYLKINDSIVYSGIIFAVFAGLNFAQSAHLVRQYIAGSLLFLFFCLLIYRNYRFALVVFIIAFFIHNSSFIPFLLISTAKALVDIKGRKSIKYIETTIVVILIYVLGLILTRPGSFFNYVSLMLDNGSFSVLSLFFDFGLFGCSVVVLLWEKVSCLFKRVLRIYTLFGIFMAVFLFSVKSSPLFLLRFYFYLEWFRFIGFISLLFFISKIRGDHKLLFYFTGWSMALLVLGLRVNRSPWDYGGGLCEHLIYSIPMWIDRVSSVKWFF